MITFGLAAVVGLGLLAASALAAVTTAKLAGHFCRGLMEFPEDLGAANLGCPASLWQLDALRRITANDKGYTCFAIFQCRFGADFAKPTRIPTDLGSLASAGSYSDMYLASPAFFMKPSYPEVLLQLVHMPPLITLGYCSKTTFS